MSADDVHKNEMPRFQPSEDEWPAGDPALAAFAEDLRTVAGGPAPEPRPGLVAVMNQGSVRIDSSPGRRKMLVKTLVGTLAAKVALGMGVAAASVTAAGAAGVLPDPAQHAVASVVSAATPFAVPDPATVTLDAGGDTGKSKSKSKAEPAATADDEAGDDEGGTRTLNHGACVSTVAKAKAGTEPGSHGKTVSSVARSDCGKTDSVSSSTTSTTIAGGSTTSSTSSTSTTVATANSNRGNSGNSGNGNGNSGNSGRGNSGRG